MESVLEKIVAQSRVELDIQKRNVSASELEKRLAGLPAVKDFRGSLQKEGFRIIAELKKASPSKGLMRENLDIETLAPQLARAGAAALSVLTEKNFFLGSLENLERARKCVDIPLLRKDFIYDEYQILQARIYGADAILLIAAMLSPAEFRRLHNFACSLDLAILCEAHSAEELDMLLENGAEIVGVNARNLKTFDTSLELAKELLRRIPAGKIAVSESAIRSQQDMKSLGVSAFLIGETLMRAECPGEKLCELLK